MVSNTASSVRLTGSSPFFFRVNPSDAAQGVQLGLFAATHNAKKVLLLRDPTQAYSVSLADAFIASAKTHNVQVINSPDNNFTFQKTPVEGFQKMVTNAMTNQVDMIFLAGLGNDGICPGPPIGLGQKLYSLKPTF